MVTRPSFQLKKWEVCIFIIDYVSDDKELKKKLLFEAHNTVYTMHPGGNKMYQDLKQHYWWK